MKQLFIQGNSYYEQARTAMHQPSRDVVVAAVCGLAKTAIEKFLRAYLFVKEKKSDDCKSMQDLIDRCAETGAEFKDVDFGAMECSNVDVKTTCDVYCQSQEYADACLGLAGDIRAIVMKALKISESELQKSSSTGLSTFSVNSEGMLSRSPKA